MSFLDAECTCCDRDSIFCPITAHKIAAIIDTIEKLDEVQSATMLHVYGQGWQAGVRDILREAVVPA